MLNKKYFSIAEVVKMTNLPAHKLRYIEKTDPKINISQIRGRRYYSSKDIEHINNIYSSNKMPLEDLVQKKLEPVIAKQLNLLENTNQISKADGKDQGMVLKIDSLLKKLNKIKEIET